LSPGVYLHCAVFGCDAKKLHLFVLYYRRNIQDKISMLPWRYTYICTHNVIWQLCTIDLLRCACHVISAPSYCFGSTGPKMANNASAKKFCFAKTLLEWHEMITGVEWLLWL
jgi:hypothetical protein